MPAGLQLGDAVAQFHLTVAQFDDTISEFCGLAAAAKKPALLEEFGYARSNADYVEAYATWLDTMNRDPDCAGWLVWRLVSLQDDGSYPLDTYDRFDVHNNGGALWDVLKAATAAGRERDRASTVKAQATDGAGTSGARQ